MPRRQLHLTEHAERLQAALDAIHAELEVPAEFPAEVRSEAAQAAVSAATSGRDLTDVPCATLPLLPDVMAETGRRAGAYEAACLALIEAAVLTGREGEVFPGVVVDISRRDGRGEVVIHEPAVRGRVIGADLPLGEEITVRLVEASIEARMIAFVLA